MYRYLLASLIVLTLTGYGCGFLSPKEETEVTETGVDVEKNPLSALGALGGMVGDLQKYSADLENMEPTETVHFNDLIAVLPTDLSGFECSAPKGQTNSMGDMKMSHAEVTCKESGTEQVVTVSVDDWAFHKAVYLPFIMSSRFSQESSDGYSKGIKIGEDPGREEWNNASNSGERSILRKKRYLVKFEVKNGTAQMLDKLMPLVKTAELPG